MLRSKKAFIQISVVLLALTVTPKLLASFSSSLFNPVLAQSPTPNSIFPLPKSLPSGTTLKVNGSSSMRVINEALKKRFIEKFPDTQVELAATGTDEALAALLRGDINLVAIGRPLTDKEKAQGLVAVPVSREKIAIIVGSDNPFKGNLTFEQFAKIFRGEITDWSQVGGNRGAIRFIDHPDSSDTRRSLSTYATFKKAPFKTGSKAIRVSQDDTAAIVQELGKDGLSYAIADQVIDLKNVRVISMHKTLPDDPRYPYSQPRGYVYKKETSDPGVLVFLGFATSAQGQGIVDIAKEQEIEAVRKSVTTGASPATSPEVTSSPSPSISPNPSQTQNADAATAANTDRDFPWWILLLLIPLGGALLWWLLKGDEGRSTESTSQTPAPTPTGPPETTGVATTAPGTVSPPVTPGIDATNGAGITGIASTAGSNIGSVTPEIAPETSNLISDASESPDAAVVSEPGATSSTAVAGIAGAIAGAGIAAGGIAGAAALAGLAGRSGSSRITLAPHDNQHVYVHWEVLQSDREWAKQQGGQQCQLRIYDVTSINFDIQPAHHMQSYECDELEQERQVPVLLGNRDYIAEIGYITIEGVWLQIARSNSVWVTSSVSTAETTDSALIGGAAAIAAGGIAGAAALAGRSGSSRMTLAPHDNQHVYVHWEIAQSDREWAKQQGGQQCQLRIYDITGINLDIQPANNVQTYECDELASEQLISVPVGERDYIAEIGYITIEGVWLQIARSNSVWVTSSVPTPETADSALIGGAAGIAAGGIAGAAALAGRSGSSRITLAPHDNQHVYVHWEVLQSDREWAKQQGGQQCQLRIYDITGINLDIQPANNVQTYECDEVSSEQLISVPEGNRDYIAEIGYITIEGVWLQIARSNSVWVTSSVPTAETADSALIGGAAAIAAGGIAGAAALAGLAGRSGSSRITLAPHDNQHVYVHWEVLQSDREWAKQQGGQQCQLRIYDVTSINFDIQPAHHMQSYECDELEQERQVPVLLGNRDYIAEIGYITIEGVWLQIARSNSVWVPSSVATPETADAALIGGAAAIAAGGIAGAAALAGRSGSSRMTLAPHDNQHVYVHWEVLQSDREWAKQQGGQQCQLRIYDVTSINLDIQPAHHMQSYECDELEQERQVPVLLGNRDYIAEIGYITIEGVWLQIARSNSVWVPSSVATPETADAALIGGAAAIAAGGIAGAAALAGRSGSSRMTLAPHDNQHVYVHWEVLQSDREWAKQQGGQQCQLRIYDVTSINFDIQPAHHMQSYECDELEQERQVPVLLGNRDYIAEIGYITIEGVWLQIARSNSVWVTSSVPTPETTDAASIGVAGTIPPPSPTAMVSLLVLSARDNQQLYAYWEVAQSERDWAKQQGGQQCQLRIYDVTGINLDIQSAHNMQSYDCDELSLEQQVSVPVGERDYIAEIGYITLEGVWLQIARSNSVWVSASNSVEPTSETTEAALIGGATAIASGGVQSPSSSTTVSHIVLSARDNQNVYAHWEVPQSERDWAKQQGGRQFQLRIYEVTGINLDIQPAHHMQSYDCDELEQERQVPVLSGNRDYIAEIGYITLVGQWLQIARSNSVWVPLSVPIAETTDAALIGGTAAIASGTLAETGRSPRATASRIVLTARDNQQVYAHWEVAQSDRDWAKQQGGQQCQLRIYDITGINLDIQPAHNMQSYDCDELTSERQVSIPQGNRDYIAEIGYITIEGQWLQLARSNSVWVSAPDLTKPSLEIGDVTLGGGAVTSQNAVELPRELLPVAESSRVAQREGCTVKHLAVHSRNHCFPLDAEQMRILQETAVSKTLEPGIHIVRIKSGVFGYSLDVSQGSQPIVLLWIYGPKVINKKTNVSVAATWSTLNGYDDTLTLEVLETATLCAFFFDTYLDDNDGEVTVSVAQLYPN